MSCKRTPKRAQGRPFLYERVAKLWAQGRTLMEISQAIGTFNSKSDDHCHRLRVALTAMHRGWKDSNGKLHKLPHRVKKSSLAASRRAGKKASASIKHLEPAVALREVLEEVDEVTTWSIGDVLKRRLEKDDKETFGRFME